MVRSCTASVSPALMPVRPYGARRSWKILCFIRFGATASPRRIASIDAWSLTDHSHSRFIRKSYGAGNTLLSSVVSIWKIFRCSLRSRPIRHAEWWRWDLVWSMNEWDCTIVFALWWCFSDLYDASPIGTDLWPPSIATRLTLT